MNEGFIFGAIVGSLVVDVQDVLQVITLRGDDEYTYSRSF
jgi:hypothetical protein